MADLIYTIVTAGSFDPGFTFTRNETRALRALRACPHHVEARVYACASTGLAKSADISVVRPGERIIASNR